VRNRWFWPSVVVGWGLIAVGVVGVLGEGRDVPVDSFARWVVGVGVAHDLLFVPVVAVAGVVLAWAVPARIRPAVTSLLLISGFVALFAAPLVAGWGRAASNPSIQPRDYASGLAAVLGVVAVIVVGSSAVAAVTANARRRGRRERSKDGAHV
jgi:hypothetical protein